MVSLKFSQKPKIQTRTKNKKKMNLNIKVLNPMKDSSKKSSHLQMNYHALSQAVINFLRVLLLTTSSFQYIKVK